MQNNENESTAQKINTWKNDKQILFSLTLIALSIGLLYLTLNRNNALASNNTLPCIESSQNLISNGSLDKKRDWKFQAVKGKAKFNLNKNNKVECKKSLYVKATKNTEQINIRNFSFKLKPNQKYILTFWAKSPNELESNISIFQKGNSSNNYGINNKQASIETTWKEFEFVFTTPNSVEESTSAELLFNFGPNISKNTEFYLDAVQLVEQVNTQPDPRNNPPNRSSGELNKKVYMLVYDPILQTKGGVKLSEYKNWQPYEQQAQEAIDFFSEASQGYLNFEIEKVVEINDKWLTKVDGYTYTEEAYLDVIDNGAPEHRPDFADYYQFLNDQELDICGALNRGEIDELWLFGGPWFGFYESAMASNGENPGFWVNGPTFTETSCEKLLPVGIPGPHNFGHRAEETMNHVYGDLEPNRQNHRWDMFNLHNASSPDFNSFGCGTVHYAANSQGPQDDYDFNLQNNVNSYCDAFLYAVDVQIEDLEQYTKTINCEEWGCTTPGYEMYWWKHIPIFDGTGNDGKLNNWWDYIFDPNIIEPVVSGEFSNLSAEFPEQGPAIYYFNYSGTDRPYKINMSTLPDMSNDVYLNFTGGAFSPVVESNPQKWDKYSCGTTLYWRVYSTNGNVSDIVATEVQCN